jgi:dTDP-4-dehydrorhamnose reductase
LWKTIGEEMTKVIMLGASGMLGSMIVDSLEQESDFEVTGSVRDPDLIAGLRTKIPGVNWCIFDAGSDDLSESLDVINGFDWIINAIGIIKPLIREHNAADIERAIRINSLLPYRLAQRAKENKAHILQIATDCVYSGKKGAYIEQDAHDPIDEYGKTKSLGECAYDNISHLRCSIIGPEPRNPKSLLEWFLNQPQGAQVNGFMNHQWNGVTTLHYAKICMGLIRSAVLMPKSQHIVPTSTISKAAMLRVFAEAYGRNDVVIKDMDAEVVIDRTLATENTDLNKRIWQYAGYEKIPTVEEMIFEMKEFNFRLSAF